ncbi:MAG: DNA-formamidopyrimidine glycosylase, partial [Abiotrophia defectiva]|nr:DNA-formamidopyrimidine glycosylase [Abiotrophia defectiva]
MPELPEVETVRRGLTSLIEGKTIAEVQVFWPKLIDLRPQETLAQWQD